MLLSLELEPRRKMISLTPLIDIVFILLLFFMLTSSFIQMRQISFLTPSASDHQTPILRVLKLESNQGLVSFEGHKLSTNDEKIVKKLVAEDPMATYVITVAKGVNTQAMVALLDNLKQAGAYQVSLAGVMP